MTSLVTRPRLLSTALRTGDGRQIRQIIMGFEARDLESMFAALAHLRWRRLATLRCEPHQVDTTVPSFDTTVPGFDTTVHQVDTTVLGFDTTVPGFDTTVH
jgi:hypothetical protein